MMVIRWFWVLFLCPALSWGQHATISVTGELQAFTYYISMSKVRAILGEHEKGGVTRYHASFAGGGSGEGYIGHYIYRKNSILLHVSQASPEGIHWPEDSLLSVRTASFRGDRSGIQLSGGIGIGSSRREIKDAYGDPLEKRRDMRRGYWYKGTPRLYELRFSIFGKLKKVIIH